MHQQNGVMIGMREIYDLAKETSEGVKSLNEQMKQYQETQRDHADLIDEIDDRSRMALEKANAAHELTKRNDANITWLWRTVVAALVTGGVGAVIALVTQ